MTKSAKYEAIGLTNTLLDAPEGIRLTLPDGNYFELYCRKSDGEVTLSCGRRMRIQPMASNMIRIEGER